MRETPAEIEALQDLLDRSAGRGGPQLLDIVRPERRLTAGQLVTALSGMKVLVVATVTATGEPRTSCLDGHFLHGHWIFSTDARAIKAKHLKARPACSATHADGERMAVFTHGYADYIDTDHADYPGLVDYLTEYYGDSPLNWGPHIVFFRLRPTWMVGFASAAAAFPE
jgi:hypothetical protein